MIVVSSQVLAAEQSTRGFSFWKTYVFSGSSNAEWEKERIDYTFAGVGISTDSRSGQNGASLDLALEFSLGMNLGSNKEYESAIAKPSICYKGTVLGGCFGVGTGYFNLAHENKKNTFKARLFPFADYTLLAWDIFKQFTEFGLLASVRYFKGPRTTNDSITEMIFGISWHFDIEQ